MTRKAIIGALALVIVAVWGLLALGALDWLAKHAINRWGAALLGAPVDVERVNLSVFKGDGLLKGLEVGRVPGFEQRAAHLQELRIRLDAATVFSGVTVVHELSLGPVQLTYERSDRGTNLDAIQRNIEAYVTKARGADGGKGAGSGSARKYVIERLTIRNARVVMTNKGLAGHGLAFDLPDVELRDVGKREGGLSSSQIAQLVTATLQQRIAMRVLTNVEALRRGGLEGAIDALRRLVR